MTKTGRAAKTRRGKKGDGVEAMREQLVRQRQEILDMYQRDLRVGQESSDEGAEDIVDRANNAYNREFMFSLSHNEREMLLQIEQALERIEGGSYGVCANCGGEIAPKRLTAVPWARFCIDCQEMQEKGLLREP